MKKIAIITGASSGLGSEFAQQIDALGEVDQIWLIARRRERLEEIAARLHTQARVVCADLSTREGIASVAQALDDANRRNYSSIETVETTGAAGETGTAKGTGETGTAERPGITVCYLVNAAGFGKIGSFRDIPLEEVDRMIDLNCRGAVDMTQIVLPYCARGSRILEICSTAGFQPFPYLNVYAASKSFLYRYSRALSMELLRDGRGVTVTAVCPYWVTDTEFIPGAESTTGKAQPQQSMGRMQQSTEQPQQSMGRPQQSAKQVQSLIGNRYIRHYPFSTRKQTVVAHALMDAQLGLSVSTPGLVCTVHRYFAKILSSNILMWCWELIRRA